MAEIIDELEYLDRILDYLYKSPPNGATVKQLFTSIYGEPFSEVGQTSVEIIQTEEGITPDYTVSHSYKMKKLRSALNHLEVENLVVYSNAQYTLTFAGIVKTTNNYVFTFNKNEIESVLRNRHMEESIKLTQDQIDDIKKSRTISRVALIVSIVTVALSALAIYIQYIQGLESN